MSQPSAPAVARGKMKAELPEHLKAYKGVWVCIEMERGEVHPVSWELLGEGRKLANALGNPLAGLLIGAPGEALDRAAAEAISFGADKVIIVADPVLEHYRCDPYTKVLTEMVNKHKPEILLLGATNLGRDLAVSVATTLKTGLTADCTELAIDAERSLAATRPTFGGSLLCTIHTLNYRPQMATIRPRVMAMPEANFDRTGEVMYDHVDLAEESFITKVLQFVPDHTTNKNNLAYADIVVAGGRGMGKAENFHLIKDLATVLNGEYGGSRPLVQAGWITADRQIGQTGKTIRPKLYIACGISGAIQHRVGVEGADIIMAINTDPNARIFEFAHWGIVADAVHLLPSLTEAFRRRLQVNRMAG